MKKHLPSISVGFISALLIVVIILLAQSKSPEVKGSALSGLVATAATSSVYEVGDTSTSTPAVVLPTPNCAARIISTTDNGISIGIISASTTGVMSGLASSTSAVDFTDSRLNYPLGIFQPASTTVAYDGGLYGCETPWLLKGVVRSRPGTGPANQVYAGSTTVSVTDTR